MKKLIAALMIFGFATSASGQSLGEIAAKEKERRKANAAAGKKVISASGVGGPVAEQEEAPKTKSADSAAAKSAETAKPDIGEVEKIEKRLDEIRQEHAAAFRECRDIVVVRHGDAQRLPPTPENLRRLRSDGVAVFVENPGACDTRFRLPGEYDRLWRKLRSLDPARAKAIPDSLEQ